jgi:ribosomal protein L7/L12
MNIFKKMSTEFNVEHPTSIYSTTEFQIVDIPRLSDDFRENNVHEMIRINVDDAIRLRDLLVKALSEIEDKRKVTDAEIELAGRSMNEAIKVYKDRTGLGLKESKDAVEDVMNNIYAYCARTNASFKEAKDAIEAAQPGSCSSNKK